MKYQRNDTIFLYHGIKIVYIFRTINKNLSDYKKSTF